MTRFDLFLRENNLSTAKVAHEAGISRQHVLRLRTGQADPRVMTLLRVRDACGRLLLRYVRINEIYETD